MNKLKSVIGKIIESIIKSYGSMATMNIGTTSVIFTSIEKMDEKS